MEAEDIANMTDEEVEEFLRDTNYDFYKNVKAPPNTYPKWLEDFVKVALDEHLD